MLEPYMLVLYGLGAFYGLLAVGLMRRSRRNRCRTCVYWQACLSQQLGLPGQKFKRCE